MEPAVEGHAAAVPRRRARRRGVDQRRPRAEPARGRRRRPRGPCDAARADGAQRTDDARRAADQLDERGVPERRLGGDDLRRARRRAPVGAAGVHRAARRAGPGRRLARAPRPADRAGSRAQRAALRRAALSRRRDRPDDRPLAGRELRGGALPHLVGPRARAEHAHRGGVRRAGLSPHRGRRSLDPAARSAGPAGRRARAALPGREDRRRESRRRRRGRPGPDAARRRRVVPRRGRARGRHVTGRADRGRLLQHALRRERELPHRFRQGDHAHGGGRRVAVDRGASRQGRQPLLGAHGLHDRQPGGRGRRRRRRTAKRCRSCATTAGCSSAVGASARCARRALRRELRAAR